MTDPVVYWPGHIKHHARSNHVAIRTIFDDGGFPVDRAWLVSTTQRGPYFTKTADVADWPDLYVPEPPATPGPDPVPDEPGGS